ncbi:hypothetical protein JRO89_XS03G0098000 [Xanthoceras sorbifolium]|uniref:Uncharacterized protein n=1 Tax=Xanthoceras sorbifolium TaxID=99658 RepID=A0ABQ8I9C8_9ROSI|nr:hypothetical protein JRO89_XS03G0098000 [Xanthoceras sorbifolium]
MRILRLEGLGGGSLGGFENKGDEGFVVRTNKVNSMNDEVHTMEQEKEDHVELEDGIVRLELNVDDKVSGNGREIVGLEKLEGSAKLSSKRGSLEGGGGEPEMTMENKVKLAYSTSYTRVVSEFKRRRFGCGIYVSVENLVQSKTIGIEVLDWIVSLVSEFQNTQLVLRVGGQANGGAVKENLETSSFRQGNVVAVAAKWIPGNFSIDAEVDATNVATGVNSRMPSRSYAGFVFEDIKALCKEVGVIYCQAIFQVENMLAYNLTSLVISSKRDHVWQGYYPIVLFSNF